ncbi:hypothetical protein FGF1_20210 [Flavobacteriaceae bacterium GF1]
MGPRSGGKAATIVVAFFVQQRPGEKFMPSEAEVSPGGTTKWLESFCDSEGFFHGMDLGEKFIPSEVEVSLGLVALNGLLIQTLMNMFPIRTE